MIFNFVQGCIKVIAKFISRTFKLPKTDFFPDNVRKILIYGNPGIGNNVLYTPALRLLRNCFPEADITFVHWCKRPSYKVLLNSGLFTQMVILDSIVKKIGFLFEAPGLRYDVVVNNFLNQNPYVMLLNIFLKTNFRLGHLSGRDWNSYWDEFYNLKSTMPANSHEVDRYISLLKPLGCVSHEVNKALYVYTKRKDEYIVDSIFKNNGIDPNDICIGVQVDVNPRQAWKRWPVRNIYKLCIKLQQNPKYKVILLGNKLTSEGQKILKFNNKKVINLIGKTDISQAALILSRCEAAVTPDSGLMHVGAAMGAKIIALYGPTDFVRTAPVGKGHKMISKHYECSGCYKDLNPFKEKEVNKCKYKHQCMKDITVEEVLKAVQDILQD